jgi:hypothetical protein
MIFWTLREASEWASHYLNRNRTISNISYLIQYGRSKRYGSNGKPLVKIDDLEAYYHGSIKEDQWKKALGDDLNCRLSFTEYRESEGTKHIHPTASLQSKIYSTIGCLFS